MQKNNNDKPYILVADSGSTKTAWCMAAPCGERKLLYTRGINPAVQAEEDIAAVVREDLMPQLAPGRLHEKITAVHFYGAGCIPSASGRMEGLLREVFPAGTVEVESDLLGAARALCGHEPGIACILGTGSNSCLYDGTHIVRHVPPLGYILGDEGSGATIGKRFVGDLLKGLLPDELRKAFTSRYGLSESDIIRKVYREPGANRFLASLAVFIYEHRHQPELHALTVACFKDFFSRNVEAYGRKDVPLRFTGSISHYFREELAEAARGCGYQIDSVLPAPIEKMTEFHLQKSGKMPFE